MKILQIVYPSVGSFIKRDNGNKTIRTCFELFEELAHVKDETSRDDTITLHEVIHNKFLEVSL